jgi:hypothetical protein
MPAPVVAGGQNPRINGAYQSPRSQSEASSALGADGAVNYRMAMRSTNWRQAHPVGDGIAATIASRYTPGDDYDRRLCRYCGGERCLGLSAERRTLIRHAAATRAIFAATLGMHPAPAFSRLVSTARVPLVAAPDHQRTIRTTIYLATIASPTDNDL